MLTREEHGARGSIKRAMEHAVLVAGMPPTLEQLPGALVGFQLALDLLTAYPNFFDGLFHG